jgi:2-phosphosulfolactate phosphatase
MISVALLPRLIAPDLDLRQVCSIVIDVLRATSVMTAAGKAGVGSIYTCEQTDRAFQFADELPVRPLLCGERGCQPIDGFDLGNSPAEYTPDVVAGRDMVLTTTNGTRAIDAAAGSRRLLVGSFFNLDATIQAIAGEQQLLLVCSGTNGEISYEDVLLAGAMVQQLTRIDAAASIDDSARIALEGWRQAGIRNGSSQGSLAKRLRLSLGGRNLNALGMGADIARCAKMNSIDGIVERVSGDESVFHYAAFQYAAAKTRLSD